MNKEISEFEEKKIIEVAEKRLAIKKQLRLIPLVYAFFSFGLFFIAANKIIYKLQTFPPEEITKGFLAGFTLSILASTFGIMGAIALTKALIGFADEYQTEKLLMIYHSRLYGNKTIINLSLS